MKIILILIAAAALAEAACVTVSSAQIVAGDLAEAVPLFRSIPSTTFLGFTPLPGVPRIFTARQLIAVLQRYGTLAGPDRITQSVCIERLTLPLSPTAITDALVSALGLPGAAIDLIDFSKSPLPPGRLEFRRADLAEPPETAPNTPVFWRGRLVYDNQRCASVWTKLRISVERPQFVAAENIPTGAVIRADQFRTMTETQFPGRGPFLSSPESIIGKAAKHSIPAGYRITPDLLEDPLDVQRGGRVHVKVVEGLACLSLDATAQSSGRKGDTILVHNPLSGRNFKAVVTDRGEAIVRPSGA